MPDTRFQNLTKQLAAIRKHTTNVTIPDGEVYGLLKTLMVERGEPFNLSDFGLNPGKRMINKLFSMMRSDFEADAESK